MNNTNLFTSEELPVLAMCDSVKLKKEYNPLAELMRCILLRAIEDFYSDNNPKSEARSYFECEEEDYLFSFTNICEHLSLDSDAVRNIVMNHTDKINTRRRQAS